ncbi:hypothetical protein BBP40_002194 [Aspergillus hancockii]|nr:hypothetical protein BBP40_002194 [Aspergillus hancockii]
MQSQVRRICLATRGQSLRPISRTLPSSGILSQRLIRSYATAGDAKGEKTKRTKSTTAAKKTKKTTKKSGESSAPKPKGRKPLTEKQKEAKKARAAKEHIKDLKKIALQEPKRLPDRPWNLAVMSKLPEAQKTHEKQADAFKAAAELAKSLTQEEEQSINARATSNKEANADAYTKWINGYTPSQIKEANAARTRLSKLTNKRYTLIRDERLVKRPLTAFVLFYKERFDQGDFKHMSIRDISARVTEEWKGMTETEKEKYRQLQASDRKRYDDEYREVYGEEPPSSPKN